MVVSVLAVGVVCWLKGESWYHGFGGGWRRGCAGGNQRHKAVRSLTSVTLKILGQDPPEDSPPGDTVPAASLFWLSLLEVCCRTPWVGSCSPWSLSAALGTQVACECVMEGGMEDAVAVKGVF